MPDFMRNPRIDRAAAPSKEYTLHPADGTRKPMSEIKRAGECGTPMTQ